MNVVCFALNSTFVKKRKVESCASVLSNTALARIYDCDGIEKECE